MLVKMFVERSPERNKSREGRKIIGGRVEIFPFAKNKIVASEIIFPTCSSREENDLSWGNEKKCSKGEKRVEVQSFYDEREISKTDTLYVYNIWYKERGDPIWKTRFPC